MPNQMCEECMYNITLFFLPPHLPFPTFLHPSPSLSLSFFLFSSSLCSPLSLFSLSPPPPSSLLLSKAHNSLPECASNHKRKDGSGDSKRHPDLHHCRKIWLLFSHQPRRHLQDNLPCLAELSLRPGTAMCLAKLSLRPGTTTRCC